MSGRGKEKGGAGVFGEQDETPSLEGKGLKSTVQNGVQLPHRGCFHLLRGRTAKQGGWEGLINP